MRKRRIGVGAEVLRGFSRGVTGTVESVRGGRARVLWADGQVSYVPLDEVILTDA